MSNVNPTDDAKNVDAFMGLGNAFLSQANYYADQAQDEDQVSTDMPLSQSLLEKALAAFEKGLEMDPAHAPTLVSVGIFSDDKGDAYSINSRPLQDGRDIHLSRESSRCHG